MVFWNPWVLVVRHYCPHADTLPVERPQAPSLISSSPSIRSPAPVHACCRRRQRRKPSCSSPSTRSLAPVPIPTARQRLRLKPSSSSHPHARRPWLMIPRACCSTAPAAEQQREMLVPGIGTRGWGEDLRARRAVFFACGRIRRSDTDLLDACIFITLN